METPNPATPSPEHVHAPLSRITFRHLGIELLERFNLEKGLLFTIREFLLRPGRATRNYLFTEDRPKFTNPLSLLLFTAAIAAFLLIQFGWEDSYFQDTFEQGLKQGYESRSGKELEAQNLPFSMEEAQLKINYIYTKYFNLLLVAILPILGLFTFLFFRKDRFFYAEHLVLNMYVMSIQNILFFPFAFFLFQNSWPAWLYMGLSLLYQIWFYLDLFTGYRTWVKVVRSITTISLAYLIYYFFMVIFIFALIFLIPFELPT